MHTSETDIIWGMSVDESKAIFNDRADIVPMPYAVMIYVLVMVAGSIFKNRFMIWIFASFVFFAHIFRVFIRAWAWHKKHPHLKAIRKDAKTKAFQWRQKLYTVGTKVRGSCPYKIKISKEQYWEAMRKPYNPSTDYIYKETQDGDYYLVSKKMYEFIGTVVAAKHGDIIIKCQPGDIDPEHPNATTEVPFPTTLQLKSEELNVCITEIIDPISYEDGIYDGDTSLSVYATYPDLAKEAIKVKVWKGETCEGILMVTTGSRNVEGVRINDR